MSSDKCDSEQACGTISAASVMAYKHNKDIMWGLKFADSFKIKKKYTEATERKPIVRYPPHLQQAVMHHIEHIQFMVMRT
jgi:hypothetical protein